MTQDQKNKNKEFTNRWRQRIGNSKRKNNYAMIRKYGVPVSDAKKMRFWSSERIFDWLLEYGYRVDDIDE